MGLATSWRIWDAWRYRSAADSMVISELLQEATTRWWISEDGVVRSIADGEYPHVEVMCSGPQRGVVIDFGEADVSAEVVRCCERFEPEEVESGAVVNEMSHGPSEGSEGNELDVVGKLSDVSEHISRNRFVDRAEATRHRPDDDIIGKGPTQPVIPQTCRGERSTCWTK